MMIASDPGELGGLVGFAATVIDAIGEWGVGFLTLLETVFPPIPSEVILPLAGFLSSQGSLSLVLVIITSTLGSLLGALVLYGLGAALGRDRAIRLLARLPLVDREDFEKAAGWFDRHGKPAIFFGRLIPGVRSLISLPAGAARMNLWAFSGLTALGSAVWNSLLIVLGSLLGRQYELIERYSNVLNYAVYAAIAGVIIWLVVRRLRKRGSRPSEEKAAPRP